MSDELKRFLSNELEELKQNKIRVAAIGDRFKSGGTVSALSRVNCRKSTATP